MPPFSVTTPPARAFELPILRVPEFTKAPPEKLLEAVSTTVPDPDSVTEPAPLITFDTLSESLPAKTSRAPEAIPTPLVPSVPPVAIWRVPLVMVVLPA